MYSHKLYAKIVGGVAGIVLFSVLGAWLLITGVSYSLSFGCLLFILLITLLLIRLINDANRRISLFFESLRNGDVTGHYPSEANDPFLCSLYNEMNRITRLFADSRAEVEEKEHYYESILRVLTHEIRNSITPIASLSADLLKYPDCPGSARQQEGLEVIYSQTKSLTAFLDSYHRLTHLPDPDRKAVDVQELFDKLSRLLCAEPNSGRIHYRLTNNCTLQADPNLILLALINLIRNALQAIAGQTDGLVSVACTGTPTHPHITVTDNGPGISAEQLSVIFTPFFSTKRGGSGIGLPVSRRIMQLHDGQLRVFSIPEVQTTFTLEF